MVYQHEENGYISMRMGISGHTYHLENHEEQKSKEPDTTARTPRCLVHGSNTHTTANCRANAEKTP